MEIFGMSDSLVLEKGEEGKAKPTSKKKNERRPCCFKEIFVGIKNTKTISTEPVLGFQNRDTS